MYSEVEELTRIADIKLKIFESIQARATETELLVDHPARIAFCGPCALKKSLIAVWNGPAARFMTEEFSWRLAS